MKKGCAKRGVVVLRIEKVLVKATRNQQSATIPRTVKPRNLLLLYKDSFLSHTIYKKTLPQLPLGNHHIVVVQDVEVVLVTVRRDFAPVEGLQHLAARFVRV